MGEGEGAGVGHVVARGIVVGGGQLQAVALLAAIALGTPVSQLPCSCERAAQFHVLPVGVALLAVDGDGLRVCHLRIPVSVPSVWKVRRSKYRCVSLMFSLCHVPTMSGPYCSFSCTVFSCASGSAYLGSSLPQEANARAAIRRKRGFACFIFL